jgi:geranylgeranyl pyrophosphate synthase
LPSRLWMMCWRPQLIQVLGKSNQSDLINKKLTYVSAYGKQESIAQAHALSNACISKLEDSFDNNEVVSLLELAKFMVERES